MTVTVDTTAAALLAAKVRGVAWLVELAFTSGTLRVTSAPATVTAGGFTWTGLGQLVSLAAVQESEDTNTSKLSITLSAVNTAMLAASIGNVDAYRGKAARIYLQMFDAKFQPQGNPTQRWAGYMDKVLISRKRSPPEGGASVGHIELQCSRAGMARARKFQGLRITDAQQQQRHPGDTGLRYVQTLLEQPSLWLSKRFQEQP